MSLQTIVDCDGCFACFWPDGMKHFDQQLEDVGWKADVYGRKHWCATCAKRKKKGGAKKKKKVA